MSDAISQPDTPVDTSDKNNPGSGVVLAVGVCGAETGSLLRLLDALPPELGVPVVLAVQYREAMDEDGFKQALGERAGTLAAVADGDPVKAGRTYLPDPDLIVTVQDGRFRVRPAEQQPGSRGTIDSLFVSLAQDQDGTLIGLVLAGTGEDGTLGVTAVREAGGLAIVERQGDAEDAPALNSPAALADFILPIDKIPECVALHARHHARLRDAAALSARSAADADRLAQIAAVLRDHTGHDFHGYKRNTFMRRIQRRMQVTQASGLDAYLHILRTQPSEPQCLFNDLLIGVTKFFRDRREFEFLEAHIIPRLFENKTRSDHLRIWVLGCSTGEETYTLAILLREHVAQLDTPPHVQIFASDIDGRALAAARVGRYTHSITADVTPERLARWFTKEGDTYSIAKELREMCIFSQHSIIKDPPFSRLDMVSCRNLLIYLDNEMQDRAVPVFHFALKPRGVLFLGNSENVSRHPSLFAPVDRAFRVFEKIETDARMHPVLALPSAPRPVRNEADAPPPRALDGIPSPRRDRIAEHYAPAFVVVNDRFEVLHFSTKAGRFIHPAGGAASLSLPSLVHGDLRPALRRALAKAAAENQAVSADGILLNEGGRQVVVDLLVEPAWDEARPSRDLIVLFKEGVPLSVAPANGAILPDEHVRRLEAELRVTHERLQVMVEELESANEELKSSNEEYQSLNEELQSANEELETSKEELQSINEEVTTVNNELAHRVQELGQANSDLKNLLQSTQIATVFLDNEMRVTNFTPAAAEIFHLVENDIQRPIGHIKSRVIYNGMQDDIRQVIRTLVPIDRAVERADAAAHYMVRILPYRSVDNFIGGAVVTFLDVTSLTRAERALRESEGRLRTLMEGIPQLVWRALDGGRRTWSSPQWSAYTGLAEEDSRDLGWLEAVHPDDREAVMRAWEGADASGGLDVEHRLFNAGEKRHRWFHTRSSPVRDERGRIVEWLGTSTEVDDLRRLQEEQKVMVAELQHRTRNLLTVVRSLANETLRGSGTLDEFGSQFNDRLSALSRVQGLLSRSDETPITLGALVRMELDALGAGAKGSRVFLDGPEVALRKSSVQTLALALHELATNARKYGALATEDGRLQVAWRVQDMDGQGRRLALDWDEEGISRQKEESSPATSGYGRKLIEQALPYTLDAETSYELDDTSLRCRISLPLAGRGGSQGG